MKTVSPGAKRLLELARQYDNDEIEYEEAVKPLMETSFRPALRAMYFGPDDSWITDVDTDIEGIAHDILEFAADSVNLGGKDEIP